MRKSILGLALIYSASAFAAGGKSTNPNPPKTPPVDISRINLAVEIPHPIEKFRYAVMGEINGVVYYSDKVPLIELMMDDRMKQKIGEVAVGSEIKLDKILGYGGRMYYGVDIPVKIGNKEITRVGWLDGMFVKISGTNSSANVK